MSHLLWKYFWNNDVDKFRQLVVPPAGYSSQTPSKSSAVNIGSQGSPAGHATPFRPTAKSRKASGQATGFQGSKNAATSLGKTEVNSRDHAGLTVLLRASSSTDPNAILFVQALLEHPAVDLYAQDPESGWNALHRALYTGNIAVARLLLSQERSNLKGDGPGNAISRVGHLIKTKDHEGNSPFDLYNSTIDGGDVRDKSSAADDTDGASSYSGANDGSFDEPQDSLDPLSWVADELYTFGSNKNRSLGVGDEDDRQFPERILLKRPSHLVQRFYEKQAEKASSNPPPRLGSRKAGDVPVLIREQPLHIRDVALSKFHSAILTKDPVSNLFICGVGRGGRLGLGDENTRFRFVPVQGALSGKRVLQVALGQNHSLAVVERGELWSWGSNAYSQLGYALPTPTTPDEQPMSLTPRQVFGPLKKEVIAGVAASAVHSVAHSTSSLYCWGRNLGQLGLMDAEARSQEVQPIPRRVAASLISTPILMASAIDKATTVLLSSNTVFVFTSYGYNIVKFPAPDVFANARFGGSSNFNYGLLNKIKGIASGGETIAALSVRGDLFLMNLNHKVDTNISATSTTNPAKIKKGAVTQAQCIWSARKDGVTSVSIGEHGSVIICTESGAVWRRIKRAKAKDAAMPGSGDIKRKDFKFQRVPGITNATRVRSSNFGTFAIVRRDRASMADHIRVDGQNLWQDLAPLLSLQGFEASGPTTTQERKNAAFWDIELDRKKIGRIAYEVLKSPDLETDLARHLDMLSLLDTTCDAVVCTTTAPELKLPVHSWMFGARSLAMRKALSEFRSSDQAEIADALVIAHGDSRPVLTFTGLDIIALLNLVLYAYRDEVIPVWNYTRQVPHLAYRYRQVRVELMKLATRLGMANLEAAARMQTRTARTMDQDFKAAVRDKMFLETGDVILELDGVDVPVHSELVCQRCPFFRGLFQGRSQGQWLEGRREELDDEETLRISLDHFNPEAFRYVLMHLYADVGAELFNEAVASDQDKFSVLVMDVMGIADELMIDRLSQICQYTIAKFVTTRNISYLLNEISPFSVDAFKVSGLQYACLHMEAMLENHLLDDLDHDLMQELDHVVRNTQRDHSSVARSGVVEALLYAQYPQLGEEIAEERQRRTREMEWKATYKEEEKKLSLSYRSRFGSLDDCMSASPTSERTRRKSKAAATESFSPKLRPMASQGDLIFNMEEVDSPVGSLQDSPSLRLADKRACAELDQLQMLPGLASTSTRRSSPFGSQSPNLPRKSESLRALRPGDASTSTGQEKTSGAAWGAAATLPTAKLDLREIMSEASCAGQSGISAGLAAQKGKEVPQKTTPVKMSQKERKKQQQEAAARAADVVREKAEPTKAWEPSPSQAKPAPWKPVATGLKTSLKEVLSSDTNQKPGIAAATAAAAAPAPLVKPLVAAETASRPVPRRTASPKPDTRFSGQTRTSMSPSVSSPSSSRTQKPLVPHSKSYIKPAAKAEATFGLTMSEIIGQQRREQELVKEAVAARPLEDIQREQEFQEWWDQESKRAQEEEEARQLARGKTQERQNERENKRGRRGRGGKRGGGNAGPSGPSGSQPAQGGAEVVGRGGKDKVR